MFFTTPLRTIIKRLKNQITMMLILIMGIFIEEAILELRVLKQSHNAEVVTMRDRISEHMWEKLSDLYTGS